MSRLYCDHLIPIREECEACQAEVRFEHRIRDYMAGFPEGRARQIADETFEAARAWQALRDFLNGVDDGEMLAWRGRVAAARMFAYDEGYKDGKEDSDGME